MTEVQLVLELFVAFAGGIFVMALVPWGIGFIKHQGQGHAFAHVFAYLNPDGIQRDLRLCQCGVSKWIRHSEVCTH